MTVGALCRILPPIDDGDPDARGNKGKKQRDQEPADAARPVLVGVAAQKQPSVIERVDFHEKYPFARNDRDANLGDTFGGNCRPTLGFLSVPQRPGLSSAVLEKPAPVPLTSILPNASRSAAESLLKFW